MSKLTLILKPNSLLWRLDKENTKIFSETRSNVNFNFASTFSFVTVMIHIIATSESTPCAFWEHPLYITKISDTQPTNSISFHLFFVLFMNSCDDQKRILVSEKASCFSNEDQYFCSRITDITQQNKVFRTKFIVSLFHLALSSMQATSSASQRAHFSLHFKCFSSDDNTYWSWQLRVCLVNMLDVDYHK